MRAFISKITTLPLLLAVTSALTPGCDHIRIGGKKFNLESLGGPHSVTTHDESHPPAMHNTTWTVDICKPLRKEKDIPSKNQCEAGTHVCGIVTTYNPTASPIVGEVDQVIPIAGNYEIGGGSGKSLEPHYQRLTEDDGVSGVQMSMKGGVYAKRDQSVIIDFQCDEERSGLEGGDQRKRSRDEKQAATASLTFVSYGANPQDDKADLLRLAWRTKYACEDFADIEDGSKRGWGFFTWVILIAFLGTATYLIFGSWLNYNRYGARGWDLLPHGDTIRDMPYLFKDWSRKVVDTVAGGGVGGRGGYSAV